MRQHIWRRSRPRINPRSCAWCYREALGNWSWRGRLRSDLLAISSDRYCARYSNHFSRCSPQNSGTLGRQTVMPLGAVHGYGTHKVTHPLCKSWPMSVESSPKANDSFVGRHFSTSTFWTTPKAPRCFINLRIKKHQCPCLPACKALPVIFRRLGLRSRLSTDPHLGRPGNQLEASGPPIPTIILARMVSEVCSGMLAQLL